MQIAIRPFLLAGIAFTGAAAVALTPIKPNLPDIQMPAINTPALELAAVPSYMEWVQQTTEADTKNIPAWEQILNPDFNGALSAAIELGTYLFQHFLPAGSNLSNPESVTTPMPMATSPLEFINTVEAMLTDPTLLPTIVDDLVQVVQVVAANTVEPVIDLVLRMTFTTIYRASNLIRATFQDVPEIAMSAVTAGGNILNSVAQGMTSIVSAALTDPLTVLEAATNGVMRFGAVIADEAIKIINAVDRFRQDIEAALVSLPPEPTQVTASSVSAAAVLALPNPAATLTPLGQPEQGAPTADEGGPSTGDRLTLPSEAPSASLGGSKLDGVREGTSSATDQMVEGGINNPLPDVTSTRSAGVNPTIESPRRPSIADKSTDGPSGEKSGAKAGAKQRSANR